MSILFKNANIVNVFTKDIQKTNLLIDGNKIVGFGDYYLTADEIIDLNGKYICPGLIDGHIHIESTMLEPKEFAKIALLHGTTTIIADPHEIANVKGVNGIKFMLEESKDLPLNFYFMLPSCVPATGFDESYEEINADKMSEFYKDKRVLGLAEMMNYVGVIYNDPIVLDKIKLAKENNKIIDGHAPLLSKQNLDKYIGAGITSDHECSNLDEALEKLSKGQWIMIREGTATKNLEKLSPILDMPSSSRALFCSDDIEPIDLINKGHIDHIIRKSISLGKNVLTSIQLASINAANYFGLKNVGAIAPMYNADFIILDDLESFKINKVYKDGIKVVENNKVIDFKHQSNQKLRDEMYNSFNMSKIDENSFNINYSGIKKCRVIEIIENEILTNEDIVDVDFDKNNGIDTARDILKIAVIERHKKTGHIGLGYIKGLGLKKGAIAASISHDSHNLIVIGTNDKDIYIAAKEIEAMGGGNIVVENGKVIEKFKLPIAGLMSDKDVYTVSLECEKTRKAVDKLGVNPSIAPFMNMAFLSLPVIPKLKLTTLGYVDVEQFRIVPLLYEGEK